MKLKNSIVNSEVQLLQFQLLENLDEFRPMFCTANIHNNCYALQISVKL